MYTMARLCELALITFGEIPSPHLQRKNLNRDEQLSLGHIVRSHITRLINRIHTQTTRYYYYYIILSFYTFVRRQRRTTNCYYQQKSDNGKF